MYTHIYIDIDIDIYIYNVYIGSTGAGGSRWQRRTRTSPRRTCSSSRSRPTRPSCPAASRCAMWCRGWSHLSWTRLSASARPSSSSRISLPSRSYISTLWAHRPTCPSGSSTFLAAASSNWSRISSASRNDAFPSAQRTLPSKTPQPSTDRPNLPRYTWLLIGARERLCCLRLITKANETGHVRCRSMPFVRHLLSMRFSKASTVSFALL